MVRAGLCMWPVTVCRVLACLHRSVQVCAGLCRSVHVACHCLLRPVMFCHVLSRLMQVCAGSCRFVHAVCDGLLRSVISCRIWSRSALPGLSGFVSSGPTLYTCCLTLLHSIPLYCGLFSFGLLPHSVPWCICFSRVRRITS